MMGSGRGGGGLSSRFAASLSDKLLRRLDGLRMPCLRLLDDRDEARSGLTLGLFLLWDGRKASLNRLAGETPLFPELLVAGNSPEAGVVAAGVTLRN